MVLAATTVAALIAVAWSAVPGSAATPRNAVLILSTTVYGGANSLEAQVARDLGMEVEVVTPAEWAEKTDTQFEEYRAVILGDPRFASPSNYQPAADNAATWGGSVRGNVVVVGGDPVDHQSRGGASLVRKGIAYAIDDPSRTGAYITTSDAYDRAAPNTPVPMLSGLGGGEEFRLQGSSCYEQAHIIVQHPVIDQLTDADLSNWGCSVHNTWTVYPRGFVPLAIARGQGDYVAPDGTVGFPYILARSDTTTLAGRNIVALGDSVSAGEGIAEGWVWHPEGEDDGQWEQDGPTVPWDDDYGPEVCHQTPQAHPRVLAKLAVAWLDPLSCTGATASEGVMNGVVKEGIDVPAQLGGAGNASIRYDANKPDLVTLSLGANDIAFVEIVTGCIYPDGPGIGPIRIGSDCEYSQEDLDTRFRRQQDGLRDVLGEIQRRGEEAGKVPIVAITQYADPFPLEWDDDCPDLDIPVAGYTLSREEVEFMRGGLRQLNKSVDAVARDYPNTVVVAPPPEFGQHRFCTSAPWTFGPSLVFDKSFDGFHEGWDIGTSKAPFHPTVAGQAAIAKELLGPVAAKVSVRSGSSVMAQSPSGARALFSSVETAGGLVAEPAGSSSGGLAAQATSTSSTGVPPAPSFRLGRAWDITTSAAYSGLSTVSLPAQSGDSVWHYTDGRWEQLPTTFANGYASAQVGSFSPFAVGPAVPTVSAAIAPVEGGRAPHAVSFNASDSSVQSGSIASYEWDFGDGQSATGARPSHTFDQSGSYAVTLRVTSDQGATDKATTTVTVTNPAPEAVLDGPTQARVDEQATFSGARSSDNRQITEIAWDFGDGTPVVAGADVTHTYTKAGIYTVAMAVQDDEGKTTVKTQQVNVEVYDFGGFKPPVDRPPTINAVKAGQAIPVRFSLGGDEGLDIFREGHPRAQAIDCATGTAGSEIEETQTAGQSSLHYDAASHSYTYVWKTDPAWADTCQRLILGLDDGSRHAADFRMR